MTTFRRFSAIARSVAMLAAAASLTAPHSAHAQQGPPDGLAVRIVNPLPLPTTGTVSGTVSATQSGSWNVSVTGTPAVTITNPKTNPVPTRAVDNPANHPFSKMLCQASGVGDYCHPFLVPSTAVPTSFTVPATTSTGAAVKRLIVRFLSAQCAGSARTTGIFLTGRPASPLVAANTGDNFTDNYLPMAVAQYAASPGLNGSQLGSSPTYISWDPGTTVSMTFDFAAAGNMGCRMQLNGNFEVE